VEKTSSLLQTAIRNRFYYGIKPLLPARFRLAFRGWMMRRKRQHCREVWPILPGSECPPQDWPGWPDGKQFALVLTHDVEGPSGLAKCRQVQEVEKKYGLHSSFNLIPEGSYRVSREFRMELAHDGFEVGLHDLFHDGRLYRNRAEFARNAVQINQYLKNWGVVGFRSGFMFHKLSWLQDLDIQYDTSTFDTDPFEPQPDGTGTIFPFWYEGAAGRGYVELPYTLPQDSTLFRLLGERTPAIWRDKVDWIARHGGMALLNVHPDYIDTEGGKRRALKYPLAYYEEFIQYVAMTYAGSYWNPLPKELAAWYKGALVKSRAAEDGGRIFVEDLGMLAAVSRPKPLAEPDPAAVPLGSENPNGFRTLRALPPKRVCMIVYSNYERDNRVMRYAEELARRGDRVEVLAFSGARRTVRTSMMNGVQVCWIQSRARKDEKSRGSYMWPVLKFSALASVVVTWRHLRHSYDLVHVHNMPDFLVFTAWFPKLTGAKIILDIHDIVPEFYASKFKVAGDNSWVRMLKKVERASARFSHHVIISNDLWREKFVARTGTAGKCTVFVNNVNSDVFSPRPRKRRDDKFIILFPGGLQWHQGVDIALRGFAIVGRQAPEAEFHIYGDGIMKESLMELSRELGLEDKVHFFDPIPVQAIVEVMANADLGVVPKRADSFGNEAYSTKIMEFMSLGIPVIVSSTKIDRLYFDGSVVRFFESGNVAALADAMLEMIRHPARRQEMAKRASEYAARNSWDTRKREYLGLVDSLCAGSGRNGS
jgi:glycosyltransferase involved in cell wall biosynthesis/peptidoglycan/xylan/chitin deacetylase (PgdA/CDA1 family)